MFLVSTMALLPWMKYANDAHVAEYQIAVIPQRVSRRGDGTEEF